MTIPADPKTYDLHQHWFRKSAAADLERVPATEITTSAIASSNGALTPIAIVTTPSGELLSIDLDGQEHSDERADGEPHCRRGA